MAEEKKPVRRFGPYAKLSAGYASDDAVMEAGPDAELLFVRSLAFCANKPEQDGFISKLQLDIVGLRLKRLPVRVKALVRSGLWEEVEGGWVVRQWLKWSKSSEEIGLIKAKDRDRKSSGKPHSDGPDSVRNPDGFQNTSAPESLSLTDQVITDQSPQPPDSTDSSTATVGGVHSTITLTGDLDGVVVDPELERAL